MKARLQRLVMNAQSHPGAMPQAPTCHAVFSSRSLVRRRISGQWSVVRSLRELLSDFLELLTDHRAVEAIDGDACLADLSAGALREGGSPATAGRRWARLAVGRRGD